MNVLIWIGCIFFTTTIITLLKVFGIALGGIPTAVIWGCTFWIATLLCRIRNKRKIQKECLEKNITYFEYIKPNISPDVLKICESYRQNENELKHYLELCCNSGKIQEKYVNVLFEEYMKKRKEKGLSILEEE